MIFLETDRLILRNVVITDALWVEELAKNHYRFHCNDVDWDDDYDDLVR